ncbi:hypothetical protein LLE29_00275 [Neisseria gonorrhoeae]|nr:hypothetical protein [Neisseria gonorrhoeae]UYA76137.1 hypothetical protein LLE29_00275 [Neisseria gonorrhoeae]
MVIFGTGSDLSEQDVVDKDQQYFTVSLTTIRGRLR